MLKALKKSRQNFTNVIERTAFGNTLRELARIVSNTGATRIQRRGKDVRAQSSQRILSKAEGLKPKLSAVDLAGSGSKHSSPAEMRRLLDKMREEDV